MARNCSAQVKLRTRVSPPCRATIRPKPVHGMRFINCANIVFPEFMAPLPGVQPQQSTRNSVPAVQISTEEY
jgi:hypothetical protein